ncbi:MAG: alpha/beta hydrolase-fold protein [Terracidiphilus sp.]
MFRSLVLLICGLFLAAVPALAAARSGAGRHEHDEPPQDTGFLNRTVLSSGVAYRFQVYLPEDWRRDDHKSWPVILFLHGRGERGSEGMWQTQIGLPQALRDHPERWPFIVVMPQCPLTSVWTDPEMLEMAMAALDQETREFHADPNRTYLSGLSLGGYGAWELVRLHPQRWAAVAIAASGIFWSYAPERWQQANTLPAEYARALGHTPLWLFHGADDNLVLPKQSEMLFDAVKAAGGRVHFWLFQGLKHDCWTRAYGEPELPRWLLTHHLEPHLEPRAGARPEPRPEPFSERLVVPLHPPAVKLTPAQLDALAGDYRDALGHTAALLYRQGEQLLEKTPQGDVLELAAESPNLLFYPNGSSLTRLAVERDPAGHVAALVFRDDRHEERWERKPAPH